MFYMSINQNKTLKYNDVGLSIKLVHSSIYHPHSKYYQFLLWVKHVLTIHGTSSFFFLVKTINFQNNALSIDFVPCGMIYYISSTFKLYIQKLKEGSGYLTLSILDIIICYLPFHP